MRTDTGRRLLVILLCLAVVAAVLFSLQSAGPPHPQSREAAQYILKNHVEQTGARNAVAAIYLNYRLFDTLFESLVLVLSVVAVIYFSWSGEDE